MAFEEKWERVSLRIRSFSETNKEISDDIKATILFTFTRAEISHTGMDNMDV